MCRASSDSNPRRCPGCVARREDPLRKAAENARNRVHRNRRRLLDAERRGDETKREEYQARLRQAHLDVITLAAREVRRSDLAAVGGDAEPVRRRPLLDRIIEVLARLRIVLPDWIELQPPTQSGADGRTHLQATVIDPRGDRVVQVEADDHSDEVAVIAALLKAIDDALADPEIGSSTLTPRQLALARARREELSEWAQLSLGALDLEDEYNEQRAARSTCLASRWPLTGPPTSARALSRREVEAALDRRGLAPRGDGWSACSRFSYEELLACCSGDDGVILTTAAGITGPVVIRLPRPCPGGVMGIIDGTDLYRFVPLAEIGSLHPDGDVEVARVLSDPGTDALSGWETEAV